MVLEVLQVWLRVGMLQELLQELRGKGATIGYGHVAATPVVRVAGGSGSEKAVIRYRCCLKILLVKALNMPSFLAAFRSAAETT